MSSPTQGVNRLCLQTKPQSIKLELIQPGFERLKSVGTHGIATNLDTRTITLCFFSFPKFSTISGHITTSTEPPHAS